MNGFDHIHMTACGLQGIRSIPYGLHACHFYPGREALIEALVPYFVAGLRAGERCIWVAAPPLPAADAERALGAAWPDVDEALERGALRILDFDRWYVSNAGLKAAEVVQLWHAAEQQALAEGYSGLRITGNTSFVGPGDWDKFLEYEHLVTEGLRGRRIVALCSYALPRNGSPRAAEVVHAHDCVFERPDQGWQITIAPRD